MASTPTTSKAAAGPSGSAPAASGSTASTTASTHISNANASTFGMPAGIHLPIFDGSEYTTWAGMLEAILALHEADDVITSATLPTGANCNVYHRRCLT